MILYLGYTKQEDVEYSQIFSVISSFLIICKLGADIIRFKRKERQENTDNIQATFWEKLQTSFKLFFSYVSMKRVFFYMLLLLTAVVSNLGTLIMTILVWNKYALIYIGTVFALNLLMSLTLPFDCMETLEKKLRRQRPWR